MALRALSRLIGGAAIASTGLVHCRSGRRTGPGRFHVPSGALQSGLKCGQVVAQSRRSSRIGAPDSNLNVAGAIGNTYADGLSGLALQSEGNVGLGLRRCRGVLLLHRHCLR